MEEDHNPWASVLPGAGVLYALLERLLTRGFEAVTVDLSDGDRFG